MALEVLLPQLGLTMREGLLMEWRKEEGETVKKGDVLFLVENDKAAIDVEALGDGILAKILVREGETVPVGTVVGLIAAPGEKIESEPLRSRTAAGEKGPGEAGREAEVFAERPAPAAGDFILASPLARTRAGEEGFDLASLRGTGPEGAVVERDLPGGSAGSTGPAPVRSAARSETEELTLSRIDQASAERLTRSWTTIPQFTLYVEVSAEGILALHDDFKKKERSVSLTVILAKLAAHALVRFPRLNAEWLGGGKLRIYRKVNVGIAMNTAEGLVVPVLRDCANKDCLLLAEEMKALAEKGGKKLLAAEDFAEGTVTLSNLGMFGVKRFRAIVNPPQTAIVSVGAVEEKAVERSGSLAFERYLEIGLTADHRAADGAYAARFLADLKAAVEDPVLAGG